MDAAGREATAYQRELAAAEDAAIMAKLDPREVEIVNLTPAEHAAFVAALAPMLEKYKRELDPALFDALR